MPVAPSSSPHRSRKRIPAFYTRNSLNVFDVAQRCHWENESAQELGHPAAYDYGAMRTNWMVHLLISNWMGDDAWISRLSARARRFNYVGDTQWMRGRVESGSQRMPPSVDLMVEGVNQRGETTCTSPPLYLVSTAERQPTAIA